MDGDVADREQKREPVLVEREQGDHEEEVEVRLDLPVPEVDEDGRGGDQADGSRHGAHPARQPRPRRDRRGGADERGLEHGVDHPVPARDREDREAARVESDGGDDPAMSLFPGPVREELALGKGGEDGAQHAADGAPGVGAAASPPPRIGRRKGRSGVTHPTEDRFPRPAGKPHERGARDVRFPSAGGGIRTHTPRRAEDFKSRPTCFTEAQLTENPCMGGLFVCDESPGNAPFGGTLVRARYAHPRPLSARVLKATRGSGTL
jgi:hypothetical protein